MDSFIQRCRVDPGPQPNGSNPDERAMVMMRHFVDVKAATDYYAHKCFSEIADSPSFDFNRDAKWIAMRKQRSRWFNELVISGGFADLDTLKRDTGTGDKVTGIWREVIKTKFAPSCRPLRPPVPPTSPRSPRTPGSVCSVDARTPLSMFTPSNLNDITDTELPSGGRSLSSASSRYSETPSSSAFTSVSIDESDHYLQSRASQRSSPSAGPLFSPLFRNRNVVSHRSVPSVALDAEILPEANGDVYSYAPYTPMIATPASNNSLRIIIHEEGSNLEPSSLLNTFGGYAPEEDEASVPGPSLRGCLYSSCENKTELRCSDVEVIGQGSSDTVVLNLEDASQLSSSGDGTRVVDDAYQELWNRDSLAGAEDDMSLNTSVVSEATELSDELSSEASERTATIAMLINSQDTSPSTSIAEARVSDAGLLSDSVSVCSILQEVYHQHSARGGH
jgi:hypothetical protein